MNQHLPLQYTVSVNIKIMHNDYTVLRKKEKLESLHNSVVHDMQYSEKLTEPEILSNAFMIYKLIDCRATSSCFSKDMHKVIKEVKN